jgi:hypothetical protein
MGSNTKPEIESEMKVMKREEERNQRRDCINIIKGNSQKQINTERTEKGI